MKIGIVMTIKDREELTKQSLEDLAASKLPENCYLVLVNDGSKNNLQLPNIPNVTSFTRISHEHSFGVKKSLIEGINFAFEMFGCDVVTNLDNDVRLKPEWLKVLMAHYSVMPNHIHSGFHSTNRNSDGSERHIILESRKTFCLKESVGGINMLFNRSVYEKYILPALSTPDGNWDYIACVNSMLDNHPIVVAVPSLIQHTGIHQSSMNHTKELPDVAADWYDFELPEVTLIGVDCNHFDQLERAAAISTRSIKFGEVKLLTSVETNNPDAIRIQPLTSKEAYNEFIVKELYKYIDTPHLLIIQGDGYVINPAAWNRNWLNYDYIGATWLYKDNMNVGNGGFSLRTRSFHILVAKEPRIVNTYPEDFQLCRTYRELLEGTYSKKYAPEEVANRFSIEAYGSDAIKGANKYSGQFGFHGWNVDFTGWNGHVPKSPNNHKAKYKKFNLGELWANM